MSFVDRIDRRREVQRTADPISLEEFGALIGRNKGLSTGPTRTGITINELRAFGITAWYSGVRYLAETVAFLPWHAFRDVGTLTEPRRIARSRPPWMDRPDTETPWEAWVEFAMYSLLNRGNSTSLKLRSDAGTVQGLRSIHPDRVRYGCASSGTKVFAVRDDHGEEVPLTTREILHIPGLSIDGKFGMSPLRYAAEALGVVAAADEAAARHFANTSHPMGVVNVKESLEEDEADEMIAAWKRFHRGLKNREEIGLLTNGATYQPIVLNADDAQLLQSRAFNVTEVSRILRVTPTKLYDLSHATYSNIEQAAIESVMDSIRPWCERFETWIDFDRDLMPSRHFVKAALEGLLRGDTLSRFGAYRIATGGLPWMLPREVREKEDMTPIDDSELPKPLNTSFPSVPTDPQGSDPNQPKEGPPA